MPTLEERVTRLEADMEEQKRLRASQDRDLSDLGEQLRVQTSLTKAIAKTQSEHTATLARYATILEEHTAILKEHTAILKEHTVMLTDHTQQFGRLEGSVDYLKDGVGKIIEMLDTLIERDGER